MLLMLKLEKEKDGESQLGPGYIMDRLNLCGDESTRWFWVWSAGINNQGDRKSTTTTRKKAKEKEKLRTTDPFVQIHLTSKSHFSLGLEGGTVEV